MNFFLAVSMLWTAQTQATTNRVEYVQTSYKSLRNILPILIDSGEIKNPEELEFMRAVAMVLLEGTPPLVFVPESKQFVMNPGESPKLMRAPEEKDSPIFINEQLLNSSEFHLKLPEVLKLLMHELGHKTGLYDIPTRDRLAQKIENTLNDFYVYDENDNGIKVEALSIPASAVQIPIEMNPYKPQPNILIFVHHKDRIEDVTPQIMNHTENSSLLGRTLGSEINTAISEIANFFSTALKEKMAPVMNQLTQALTNSLTDLFNKERQTTPDFAENLPKGVIQYMTLLEIQKISLVGDEVQFESNQFYSRSHRKNMTFNVTGMPFKDSEIFPIQMRLNLTTNQIQSNLTPKRDFSVQPKVGRISREGDQIKSIEIKFSKEKDPSHVDLGLQAQGLQLRLRAKKIEPIENGNYKATFEFDKSQYNLMSVADRLVIDDEEVLFLDRKIEIRQSQQKMDIKDLDLPSDAFGVWGLKGTEQVLLKEFSHVDQPFLFPVTFPGAKQITINPFGIWIEFEIPQSLDVLQAELFWTRSQMILETNDDNILTINETNRKGETITQRYAGSGGAILEQNSLRESLLFENITNHIQTFPGHHPGMKLVRMLAVSEMKYIRNLLNDKEAHVFSGVTPLGIKITTTDLHSHIHSFTSKHNAEEFKSHVGNICEGLLKATNIRSTN